MKELTQYHVPKYPLLVEWEQGWCFCFKGVDRSFGDKKKSTKELRLHLAP